MPVNPSAYEKETKSKDKQGEPCNYKRESSVSISSGPITPWIVF